MLCSSVKLHAVQCSAVLSSVPCLDAIAGIMRRLSRSHGGLSYRNRSRGRGRGSEKRRGRSKIRGMIWRKGRSKNTNAECNKKTVHLKIKPLECGYDTGKIDNYLLIWVCLLLS